MLSSFQLQECEMFIFRILIFCVAHFLKVTGVKTEGEKERNEQQHQSIRRNLPIVAAV